jgi:hypothetical protein
MPGVVCRVGRDTLQAHVTPRYAACKGGPEPSKLDGFADESVGRIYRGFQGLHRMDVEHYESFLGASVLLPKALRAPVCAVYRVARCVTEAQIAQGPGDGMRLCGRAGVRAFPGEGSA